MLGIARASENGQEVVEIVSVDRTDIVEAQLLERHDLVEDGAVVAGGAAVDLVVVVDVVEHPEAHAAPVSPDRRG